MSELIAIKALSYNFSGYDIANEFSSLHSPIYLTLPEPLIFLRNLTRNVRPTHTVLIFFITAAGFLFFWIQHELEFLLAICVAYIISKLDLISSSRLNFFNCLARFQDDCSSGHTLLFGLLVIILLLDCNKHTKIGMNLLCCFKRLFVPNKFQEEIGLFLQTVYFEQLI